MSGNTMKNELIFRFQGNRGMYSIFIKGWSFISKPCHSRRRQGEGKSTIGGRDFNANLPIWAYPFLFSSLTCVLLIVTGALYLYLSSECHHVPVRIARWFAFCPHSYGTPDHHTCWYIHVSYLFQNLSNRFFQLSCHWDIRAIECIDCHGCMLLVLWDAFTVGPPMFCVVSKPFHAAKMNMKRGVRSATRFSFQNL